MELVENGWEDGVNSVGSGWGPVADSYEWGYERSDSGVTQLFSQLVSLVSFAVFWDTELRRLVDIAYKLLHPRTQKSSYLSP
jgi:hypothetical protein